MYSPAKRRAFAALVTASLVVQPASAVEASVSQPSAVHRIYWLRTLWGQKYEFWRSGPVVGGFIMGGVLVASAIAQHRATEDAVRNCAEDFPGFDPRTGTFVNEDGERRVCPYLF
jgi:hypothetical protein